MSLLTIENISKSYFHRNVLDRISIRIQEGDRLGFIGPNGAGKTTLFKIITGRETPDEGQIIKPNNVIIGYLSQHMEDYSGSDFTALRNKELEDLECKIHELESRMGHFSDHESLEYRIITNDYAKLTAQFEALDGYSYERNMKETLQGLGLADDALLRPFTTLSGGEKMRVALARILLTHPDILLLDEPTNHLDVNAMEWLEEYLSHFKGAMILISHDRYFLDKVTNQTAELDGGKLSVRPGNYSKYKEQKQIEFDFAQKEIARLEKELEHQTEVKQTMLSHRNMSGYHCREKQVNKLSDRLLQAKGTTGGTLARKMNFKIMPKEQVGDPKRILIEADHLSKSFDGRTIFSEVSFRFRACDKIVLVGPNGCGKSTLLSLILGNIPDFEGVVRLSSQIQYAHMGQHVTFEDEGLTALEEVLARCDCSEGYARSLLARFGFVDTDCFKKIAVLSGGERSRLYLACLLQELPDVLFLDEPTNHLDIPSREILENALVDYTGAVFAVSHDRYFIEKCVKGIYGFLNGRLKEFDSYDQFRSEEKKVRQTSNEDRISPDGGAACTDDPSSIQNPARLRQNKAEERRQTAQKRERIRAAEQEIHSLEEEKAQMESGFSAETTPEEYQHYADVLTRIDRIYEIYMELQDEE